MCHQQQDMSYGIIRHLSQVSFCFIIIKMEHIIFKVNQNKLRNIL